MPEWLSDIGFQFEQADWFTRLVFALVAGTILGIDREVRRRRIGIRTYMMVSLGAAIFTIVSVEMTQDMTEAGLSADPTRVIQGLIGGLGFLGVGAIIQGDKSVGGMVSRSSNHRNGRSTALTWPTPRLHICGNLVRPAKC